jgi:hypothetical protein
MNVKRNAALLLLCTFVLTATGCHTLREIASLKDLEFSLSRAGKLSLAGVDLSRVQSPEALSTSEMLRLGTALVTSDLPLEFTLYVAATNPESNSVNARLVRLDWTLFLNDRETISGFVDDEVAIPPGGTADIPVGISLNLVDFFESDLPDMLQLALDVAGGGGPPKRVYLRATPSVTTVLGPVSYPRPITIFSAEVGS